MKIQFQTGIKDFSAEIERDGDQLSFRPQEGSHFKVDVTDLGTGRYAVVINGQVFRCSYEGGAIPQVIVNGKRIPVEISDDRRMAQGGPSGSSVGGRVSILSPMPGKLVNVLCAEGDEVIEGQGLVVVEAMKMQNELSAPRAGKVVELRAVTGQTVNAGEVLVIVE